MKVTFLMDEAQLSRAHFEFFIQTRAYKKIRLYSLWGSICGWFLILGFTVGWEVDPTIGFSDAVPHSLVYLLAYSALVAFAVLLGVLTFRYVKNAIRLGFDTSAKKMPKTSYSNISVLIKESALDLKSDDVEAVYSFRALGECIKTNNYIHITLRHGVRLLSIPLKSLEDQSGCELFETFKRTQNANSKRVGKPDGIIP